MKSETHIKHDPVAMPQHYQLGNGKEVLDYIMALTNALPVEISYAIGNAVKYVGRAPRKGRLEEDLDKALYYSRDVKARTTLGIDDKNYRGHLKTLDLGTIEGDIMDFGCMVSVTYPEELRELVVEAIQVWAVFFNTIEVAKGHTKVTEAEVAHVLTSWISALDSLKQASHEYIISK